TYETLLIGCAFSAPGSNPLSPTQDLTLIDRATSLPTSSSRHCSNSQRDRDTRQSVLVELTPSHSTRPGRCINRTASNGPNPTRKCISSTDLENPRESENSR